MLKEYLYKIIPKTPGQVKYLPMLKIQLQDEPSIVLRLDDDSNIFDFEDDNVLKTVLFSAKKLA